jgi:hypothetical protein
MIAAGRSLFAATHITTYQSPGELKLPPPTYKPPFAMDATMDKLYLVFPSSTHSGIKLN